jgi:type I restriction enzyme S subunit
MEIRQYKNIEYSRVMLSELGGKMRIDSEFYSPQYIRVTEDVVKKKHTSLAKLNAIIKHPTEIKREYDDEGVTFLRTQNLRPLNVDFSASEVFISSDDAEKLKSNILFHGDVLMTRTGANFGDTATFLNQREKVIASSHILVIRSNKINSLYLTVFLNSFYGRKLIDKGQYGGLQPEIAPSYLYNLPIPFPTDSFQQKIEQLVIKAYNQKQASENLYREAENLLLSELGLEKWQPKTRKFNLYGVDFEVEDSHSLINLSQMLRSDRLDSEYWEAKYLDLYEAILQKPHTKLGAEVDIKSGFPFQSKEFIEDSVAEKDDVPFIRIRDCKPHYIDNETLTRMSAKYVNSTNAKKAKVNDITIGMDGIRYFLGSLVSEPAYVNQRVCHISVRKDSEITPEYALLIINGIIGQYQLLRKMTIADTVGHIKNTNVANLIIPISQQVEKISQKVRQAINNHQNSKKLLALAKRAVEIYIEQDEATAEAYILANEQMF